MYDLLQAQYQQLVHEHHHEVQKVNHFLAVKGELVSKIRELSQTKFFKWLSLLQRTKHVLLKEDWEQKKQFAGWVKNKIFKRSSSLAPLPSVLNELYAILDKPMVHSEEAAAAVQVQGTVENFETIYAQRSRYYSTFLHAPYAKETEEIVEFIKKKKYKAIIVYPEAVYWEPVQRPQQLLREFASRGYLAIFCEPSAPDEPFSIQEVEENLIIIKKEAYLLPFLRNRSCIVLCTWLMQLAWAEHLNHKVLWYDLLDQLEFFSLYDNQMQKKHKEIVGKANIVTYSAVRLKWYLEARNDAMLLPNAANTEDFKDLPPSDPPALIRKLIREKKKIIGYFGAIEHWFDAGLINHIARNHPDWAFVLIGPSSLPEGTFTENNIFLPGKIPYLELPSYARFFDVGIIPFAINDLTNNVSPVKFFEYQALGLPVVSTPIAEMKQYEGKYVAVCDTVRDFEQAIQRFLGVNREEAAFIIKRYAMENSWKHRVEEVERLLLKDYRNWSVYSNVEPRNEVTVMAATFLHFDGDAFYSGGAERYLLDLHQICEKLGVKLAIYQYGNFPWVRKFKNVEIRSLSRGGHHPNDFSVETIQKFNRFFYEQVNGLSILNIYSAFFEAWPLSASPSIGISHGIAWDSPSATYETGSQFWELNRRFIEGAKQCQLLISVDTNTANWFQTIDYRLGKKIQVIPNYVNLDEFFPRADYLQPREKTVIVYPRRLYDARGLYLVLHVMDDILERYPHVEFHFVGKGFEEDTVHVRKKQERWKERVQWYWLDPDHMPQAYKDADIALIPTLYSEGTSLSCLEAMASGNAVIATRVGGLTDLVINHYNGLLIEPQEQALKQAIELLLQNRETMSLFKQRAVKVAAAFSKKHWIDRWQQLIATFVPSGDKCTDDENGKLVEIHLKEMPEDEVFGQFVQTLISEGHLVYIFVKKGEFSKTDLSFGKIQWFHWGDTRLTDPDIVIAHSEVRDELRKADIVFDTFAELAQFQLRR
jgi:glycosyltransferase involved in cell wall biosynthesis